VANWALVIGIDEYWTERACLKGAVNDALAMREWLLATGGVDPKNLKLLLSPRAGRKPKRLSYKSATRRTILNAVEELVKIGTGERLYFFFAGHGLTAHIANREESMIAPADFSLKRSDRAIPLRAIWEQLETTRFADQFLFVDACRDAPPKAAGALRKGKWPGARNRVPGQAPVQQFILYATSPGLRAKELEKEAGREQGAFTSALLASLDGAGWAKLWSSARRVYEVRWERVAEQVRREFESRKLGAILGDDGLPLYQIPQDTGSRGVSGRDRNPVLASIRSKHVRRARLIVQLAPSEVVSRAEVEVRSETGAVVRRWPIREGQKLSFALLPRTYGLRAWAPEYREKFARPPVDLYGEPDGKPTTRLLELDPGEADPRADEGGGRGSLAVRCDDPLTAIEVVDSNDDVIAVAYGRLHLPAAPKGFYRARLRLPKGTSAETLVELLAHEAEEITLAADSPPVEVRDFVTALGGEVNEQNLVAVSDAVGPMASAHVSTVLALAGARSLGGARGEDAVARLGFPPVTENDVDHPTDALVVLVGADSPERLADLEVRLWRLDETIPTKATRLVPSDAAPAEGQAVLRAPAGPHWLSLEPAGGAPMVFALASLPGQATMIVAQAERTRFRLYQYLPHVDDDTGARERGLRRLELAQRLVLGNGIAAAGLLARDFVNAATLDPLAATLGAYVLLRLGLARELDDATRRLVDEFGELSDVHVLRGEAVAATEGLEAARDHFVTAAEVGVPIFGEGLTRLLEAAKVYELRHEHIDVVRTVFEGHMSGSMWSVWLPGELEPASPLVPRGLVGSRS